MAKEVGSAIALTPGQELKLLIDGNLVHTFTSQLDAVHNIYFDDLCYPEWHTKVPCDDSDFDDVFDLVEHGYAFHLDIDEDNSTNPVFPDDGYFDRSLDNDRVSDDAPCMGAGFGLTDEFQ